MLIAPIWLNIRTSNFRNTFDPGQTVNFRISMTGSAVLILYTRVMDVRTTELPWHIYALQHRPTVASKESNAINLKTSLHAGRLFETARLRQTKSSSHCSQAYIAQ